jgi:type IV pilus assembly protein PilV
MRHNFLAPKHKQSGFALIEVLISLLIMTIGVLGLAGLQFYALKFNRSSAERSQAAAFAYQLADKMRTNYGPARSGSYGVTLSSQPSRTPAKDCTANNCTSNELAAYDLSTWYDALSTALPGSQIEVICGDTPCGFTSQHRITVYWADKSLSGSSANSITLANCPVAGTNTDTSCISFVFQP